MIAQVDSAAQRNYPQQTDAQGGGVHDHAQISEQSLQANNAPQSNAPQGYAQQGYVPRSYAPQGYAPQGYHRCTDYHCCTDERWMMTDIGQISISK